MHKTTENRTVTSRGVLATALGVAALALALMATLLTGEARAQTNADEQYRCVVS